MGLTVMIKFPVSGAPGIANCMCLGHRESQLLESPKPVKCEWTVSGTPMKCERPVSGILGKRNTFTVEKMTGVRDTGEMQYDGVCDTRESGIACVPDTGKLSFDYFLFFPNFKPLILTLKQQPFKKRKILE